MVSQNHVILNEVLAGIPAEMPMEKVLDTIINWNHLSHDHIKRNSIASTTCSHANYCCIVNGLDFYVALVKKEDLEETQ